VQDRTGWPVNLSKPAMKIHVEILTDEAFVMSARKPARAACRSARAGACCLLSGRIDSPVAAWRMIRRGCRAHFVHFHSYPILSRASQDKARTIARELTRHQLKSRLYSCRLARFSSRIVVTVPPPLRVVVYRRLMLRIAESLASKCGALALVTGDVVGQVASQTVENLDVVGRVATLPCCGRSSGSTRTRSRRRRSGSDVRDIDHQRRGLLHAVHAAVPVDPRDARGRGARGSRAGSDGPRRRRGPGDRRGRLQVPAAEDAGNNFTNLVKLFPASFQ
jgi:hypothetical protein